jgi:hypothetical protein
MQTFLMVVVILVLLTPLLLFYGLPFIIAAKLFHRHTALWLSERTRFIAACGIASLGIAPAFDDFWMPKSIYLYFWNGDPVNPGAAVLSFALTCAVVTLKARTLARKHSQQYA